MKNKDLSRFYPNAGKLGNDEFLRKSDGGSGSGLPAVTTEDDNKGMFVENGKWMLKHIPYTQMTTLFSGTAEVESL